MKKLIKKGDLVLAGIFLASAILIAFSTQLRNSISAAAGEDNGNRLMVEIDINGEEYTTVPLDTDQVITISNEYGMNVITIADGQVCVTESDCSNQVCVDTGSIQDVGRMIVCLPHLLSITIISEDGSEAEYDAIAY